jgi:N-acetylneuraminate synthase
MVNFSSPIRDIASTYTTDDIFIIGKGPSIDEIQPESLRNALVIGVNDAERIGRADITIFHDRWVGESIVESGPSAQLYITSQPDFRPQGRRVVNVPYVPLTQESSELVMQRFMSDDVVMEDLLFMTALKIAKVVAGLRGRRQNVYMVGFDFDAGAGYSRNLARDFSPASAEERAIRISVQEFYFLNALYFLKNTDLDVRHVGRKSFSAISAAELNHARAHVVKSRSNSGIKVVAELTTNHFGDLQRLERMIRAADAAGADYVKLQKRDVESFYTKEQLASPYVSPFGPTFGDYRRQLELDASGFEFVDRLCKELQIGWFASVLDLQSFRFMTELGASIVKLPSTISEHKEYLAYVAQNYAGSVVLSTGMTDEAYERFVLENFTRCQNLFLLQCNSAYPTPLEDCNIAVVRHYHDLSLKDSRIIPGYSSHDFGWKASCLAVAAGAKMIEKHVKLGNTEWAHFDAVAVDLLSSDFREFVDHVREAEQILGSPLKKVNRSEHHKYRKAAA